MNKEFTTYPLSDSGLKKGLEISTLFDNLLNELSNDICPNNREFSIVKTKLEEACFFAKKSMSIGSEKGSLQSSEG